MDSGKRTRIGSGFDIHRTQRGLPLVLGGVKIDCDFGLVSETDGDVVLHALADAILAAAGLPDIGEHFPPGQYRGAELKSDELLGQVWKEAQDHGLELEQVDATIFAEEPSLAEYYTAMQQKLAALLGVTEASISVKARTFEGLGSIGEGKAIAAMALVLAMQKHAGANISPARTGDIFSEKFALEHEGEICSDAVLVNADGGSRGNPGPAAAGVLAREMKGPILFSEGRHLGNTTSNVAEYESVLLALQSLVERRLAHRRIVILLDSKLVYSQIVGRFKAKDLRMRKLLSRVLSEIKRFSNLRFSLVPREENRAADGIVNKVLDDYSG
ncbi:MAG: 2-C-methyl-D-erythritol 2,4-cyclodiphosphate synthase [Candidatus Riflebacteria bacterium RBG_13_59_9]|nr:MAG: 2-C-methyl-D-erythritol 2,4-cyclodiphosphate synthase [Candidatus Riflebacteria bacterium RBG_13_59_9]